MFYLRFLIKLNVKLMYKVYNSIQIIDTHLVRRIFIYGAKYRLINVLFCNEMDSIELLFFFPQFIFGLPGQEDMFPIINYPILYAKKYTFDC